MVANLARGAYSALGAGWHKGVQWGVGAPIAKLRRRSMPLPGVEGANGIADLLSAERAIRLPEPFEGRSLGRIGSLEVRLATRKSEIRRAQRLRYKVFYEEMSAVPSGLAALSRRDVDSYDAVCDHLLVLDHAAPKRKKPFVEPRPEVVVGPTGAARRGGRAAYRLLFRERVRPRAAAGRPGASAAPGTRPFLRAQAVPEQAHVELLWQGIYAYVLHHKIDALIGCASLEGTDPDRLALPLAFLHHHARAPEGWRARALPKRAVAMDRMPKEAVDTKAALHALPPLIKGYLRLGATFGDGAVIDHQFGTTDVFVTLPVEVIGARYRGHFAPAG